MIQRTHEVIFRGLGDGILVKVLLATVSWIWQIILVKHSRKLACFITGKMLSIKVSEYKQIYTSKTALPWDRSNLITISIMNFNPPKEAYKSKKK